MRRSTEKAVSKIRVPLLIILDVLLLSILGFNIMYDFSKLHSIVYYDILSYVSVLAIPMLILVVFFNITIAVLNVDEGRLTLTWVLLIPFIYVMEVLVNYPNIWARDVYLHGQIWELDVYGKLCSIHYLYPKEYPGFFLMLYEIYNVLGIRDIRVANLFVFYPALMLVLMILIYLASQRMFRNRLYAITTSIMAFNLLQFNRNELTFIHANTRLYALIQTLLIFYAMLLLRGNKHQFVALFMTATTLAISHPLFLLVPPSMLLLLVVLRILSRLRGGRYELESKYLPMYLFLVALIVLAWNIYNYYNYNYTVKIGIISFFNYLYHVMGWELISTSITIRETLPFIGIFLRNYYKVTITVTTLIALIYVFRRMLNNKLSYEEVVTSSLAGAIGIVFLSTVFTASLGNSIDRMLISLPIPITILFIKATSSLNSLKIKLNNAWKPVVVVALVFTTLAGYLLVHEEPVLHAATIPLDNASLYIRNYMDSMNDLTVTSPFGIYYQYFDPSAPIRTIRIDLVNNLSDVTSGLLSNQGVKVVDLRSVIAWGSRYDDLHRALGEFDAFVLTPLNNHCSLVYNNGVYERVYIG
jgi:hypothetical protein